MKRIEYRHDFVVVGGGIAGIAAAIAAARAGLRVALVQDRPVLGGNASKEVRVRMSGAYHCNFVYSHETGLLEEMLLENLRLNPTCSPEGWDLVLTRFVRQEGNLECFLNTAITEVGMAAEGDRIISVEGYTSGCETHRILHAPLYADCTGDGVVAALAGAPFRIGVEARAEFDESLGPEVAESRCMGSSIAFHTRDAGRPVPFAKPPWVQLELGDEDFGPHRPVCPEFLQQKGGFWWLEWGGGLDVIHESETIRDRLLEIVYAVWDYLKNRSPIRHEIGSYELDWVGAIVGRRESRRVEGDHILSQGDIEVGRHFDDAVAFGGWGFDDHPRDGFFDRKYPSFHIYHGGPYNIPFRCLYSRMVRNLLLAGRNISTTHQALSSTRPMLTCGQLGEAIGVAASYCRKYDKTPRELVRDGHIGEVQVSLQEADHHIHGLPYRGAGDIAPAARVSASSTLAAPDVDNTDGVVPLRKDRLWQFPICTEALDRVSILLDVASSTTLEALLYQAPENGTTRPAEVIWSHQAPVHAGAAQWLNLDVGVEILRPGWHFLEIKADPAVRIHFGLGAPTGALGHEVRPSDPIRINPYSRWQVFCAPEGAYSGMAPDSYCFRLSPQQPVYQCQNVVNPWSRPTHLPNLWISQPFSSGGGSEWVQLEWKQPQTVHSVHLFFDSALESPITQLWAEYPRDTIPSLVRDYRLSALTDSAEWRELAEVRGNYQRHRVHTVGPVQTQAIRLDVLSTNGLNRAQVYAIRVY